MQQTDVLSTRLAASGAVSPTGVRARLRGVYLVPGTSAGSVTFKNGGSGGTSTLVLDTPAMAANATVATYVLLPGEGQLFSIDCYATISNCTITALWS